MLIFGVVMWLLNIYCPLLVIVRKPWSWLGWGVMAIALLAPIVALSQFRLVHTTVNPHKPETTTSLVTSGVYAWTRNPMYLGLSVLLLGWAIKLGALSPLVGPLLFISLMQYVQIPSEEDALRIRFGKDYQQYCHRVNRWLGRRRREPRSSGT